MGSSSPARAWWHAVRPHTLPAGAAPVIVGSALAGRAGVLDLPAALSALAGALFIQVGTNLANDYFDARRGVDREDREGFVRATASGLLSPRQVLTAAVLSLFAAALVGIHLVLLGGVPILVVGVAGILLALLYAGGPVPLGSVGLGDVLVFLFFGVVAVAGTYYVQAVAAAGIAFPLRIPPGTVPGRVLLASLPVGALNTAILVVNNLRDLETDRRAGKYTLAVILGVRASRLEYTLLLGLAFLVPVLVFLWGAGGWVLLPLLAPGGVPPPLRAVWTRRDGDALNPALSRTARLLLVYALLWSAGILLASTFPGLDSGLQ